MAGKEQHVQRPKWFIIITSMKNSEHGFTIVEMMTTVVVAALMIGIFYQLFLSIIQSGATARRDAAASTLGASLIKQYQTTASTGGGATCVANTTVFQDTGNATDVGDYRRTVSATCPYTSIPEITKITVVIEYGKVSGGIWPLKVSQSAYVN